MVFGKSETLSLLTQLKIEFSCIEHPPIFTCSDAAIHLRGAPGQGTKNLFLRDKKGRKHFLVSVPESKQVDLGVLAKQLGVAKLGFGTAEKLRALLGVDPGSVTIFGLLNDSEKQVSLFVDRELWSASLLHCHTLVNTATVLLSPTELDRFLSVKDISYERISIPAISREE